MSACEGRRIASRIALRRAVRNGWWSGVTRSALATKLYGHLPLQFHLFRLRLPDGGGNGAAHQTCNRSKDGQCSFCRGRATTVEVSA